MKYLKFFAATFTALALVLAITTEAANAQTMVVIVNKEVPAESLSADELKLIYLGKKTFWSNNKKIELSVHQEGTVHEKFLKKYLGKTPEQFRNYWNKILYTGKGIPPTPFKTEKEVVEYVEKTEGAVGYVSAGTARDGVKTVSIK
jgi:ABC-type phosphate transport system substrate-binding protein